MQHVGMEKYLRRFTYLLYDTGRQY